MKCVKMCSKLTSYASTHDGPSFVKLLMYWLLLPFIIMFSDLEWYLKWRGVIEVVILYDDLVVCSNIKTIFY